MHGGGCIAATMMSKEETGHGCEQQVKWKWAGKEVMLLNVSHLRGEKEKERECEQVAKSKRDVQHHFRDQVMRMLRVNTFSFLLAHLPIIFFHFLWSSFLNDSPHSILNSNGNHCPPYHSASYEIQLK